MMSVEQLSFCISFPFVVLVYLAAIHILSSLATATLILGLSIAVRHLEAVYCVFFFTLLFSFFNLILPWWPYNQPF